MHRPVGRQPGPCAGVPRPAAASERSPSWDCLCRRRPGLRRLPVLRVIMQAKKHWGAANAKNFTHHSQGGLNCTGPPDLDLACYVMAPNNSSSLYLRKTSWNSVPPPSYDRIPDRHACGSTKCPMGTPRVHRKTVLRSGKAHRLPTLRVAASRAKPSSPANWPCSLLMGSAGFNAPRTQRM